MNRLDSPALVGAPAPVFVVGSPRSGTSILTWCLGQHSNLLPLEESAWMGDFAADAGARHWLGSSWADNSQFKVLGVMRDAFLAEVGGAIDRTLRGHAAAFEFDEMPHEASPDEVFRLRRSMSDPKRRWVDGTPGYSLQICALRKLFPAAKFIHIVRRCDDVVASMLNFHRIGGYELASGPAAAYAYWFDMVSACLLAEEALGKDVVHRLRYADLVEQPQSALAGILRFLGEPFESACLQPLAKRINSSQVPDDFRVGKSAVDAELLQRAARLDEEMQRPLPPLPRSEAALQRFDAAFEARVRYIAGLDGEYAAAQREVVRLNAELDGANAWAGHCDATIRQREARIVEMQSELAQSTRWALRLDRILGRVGLFLVAQCLLFAALLLAGGSYLLAMAALSSSCVGALAYMWMRRARFLSALRRLRGPLRISRFH